MSDELLRILRSAEHQSQRDFSPLDRSWLYWLIDYRITWLPGGESPPETGRHLIPSKRWSSRLCGIQAAFMSSTTFRKSKSPILDIMPNMFWNNFWILSKVRAATYCSCRQCNTHIGRKPWKFCESNFIKIAPHPCYIPDLTSSDACLFGYGKHYLTRASLFSFSWKWWHFRGILSDTLFATFHNWNERLIWTVPHEAH
jgi:hypothetical protein